VKYLWVCVGGALGSLARYSLGVWIYDRLGTRFPYGTFAINLSGSFLIGLVLTLLDDHAGLPTALRYAIPIGFIGAYTTFSTFEYESWTAVRAGEPAIALANIALSVVLGYLAVWLGALAGKLFA
jgi:CrcB protein